MRRLIIYSTLLVAFVVSYTNAFAWGRQAHAAIAYIAECNLTPEAKANIEKCIDGHSIVYYASWLDNHRKEHKEWDNRAHVAKYNVTTGKPVGKGYKNIKETLRLLKNYKSLPDSVLKVNIYFLVHTLGDFHCPGHVSYVDDNGKYVQTSSYPVKYLDEKKPRKYHQIWDSEMLATNLGDWGYIEYEEALDRISPEEKAEIQKGNIGEWMADCSRVARRIYSDVPEKPKGTPFEELSHVDKKLVNEYVDLACDQILKGGLRMAKVINDIFGE